MTKRQLLDLKSGDLIRLRGQILYYRKTRGTGIGWRDTESERFCTVVKVSPYPYRDFNAQTEILSNTGNANCEFFLNNEVVSMLVNPDFVDLINSNSTVN
jgi:hypothetical protein